MTKRHPYKYAVVGINIKTMERRQWPSVKATAEWAGKSLNWANQHIRKKVLWKGFLIGYESEEDAIRKAVEGLLAKAKTEQQPAERKPKDTTGYASLRIDRNTIILVPERHNVPEYADYYAKKLKGLKMPPFEQYLIQQRMK